MGGVAKTTKKAFESTIGGTKKLFTNPKKLTLKDALTVSTGGGMSPLIQGWDTSLRGPDDPGITGPFSLDQAQLQADLAAINSEGQKQYDETLAGIKDYGVSQNQRAKELFGSMLPDIAENSQAAHLYDSTGYGQEVARQQSQIASQIAADEAGKRYSALGGKQNFNTSALQRGLSLEDFINQANVAKTIGAQMAPQPASGKSSALSGGVAGAGAGAPFGPWGAGIGGIGGALLGSQANKRGGK